MFTSDRTDIRAFARRIAPILALTATIAGSGCHNSPTGADNDFGANDLSVIVALGDSITFGVLDTNVETCDESNRGAGGFCPVLQSLSGKTVINEGICGEESDGGVERINGVLFRWRPSVILLDYGANNLIFGAESIISDLRIMIAAARANSTVPVIGTLLPAVGPEAGLASGIARTNTQILELCAEQKLVCADHYKAFVNDRDFQASPFALLSDDGLHPNHAGYALMAKTWRDALKRVY